MTQDTRVYKIVAADAERLQESLKQDLPPDAEWRTVPYARYSVKALGTVLTAYNSGKLLIQGSDLDMFEGRFLNSLDLVAKPKKSNQAAAGTDTEGVFVLDALTVGSDEAGKGDYFGPLVVAAVFVSPADQPRLKALGVTDSKAVADAKALRLAGLLEAEVDHEIVVLEPLEYNERHAKLGNLNLLLAELHAQALQPLLDRHPDTAKTIVDKFGREELVRDALARSGAKPKQLIQVTRAEQHPAVAAASLIARAGFLDGLARCADRAGTDLHKGAGPPVDACGRRVLRIGGREMLRTIAKLHFKNSQKIGLDA